MKTSKVVINQKKKNAMYATKETLMTTRVTVEAERWLVPELEGDGAVMTGDSAKDGEDVGDATEDGEVIGVPAD